MADVERYEAVRYIGYAYDFSHPDRLALIARLRGVPAPDVEAARVLELGCGDGVNALGIACSLPGAQILAIDRCAGPLETAREAAAALGADNIRFEAVDLAAFDPGEQTFDYIIAHGLLSWLTDAERHALLALIGRCLSPRGAALVSFNALPGWRFRLIARDIITAALGERPRPDQLGEARRVMRVFAEGLKGAGLYGAVVDELNAFVDSYSDMSLYHDLLEPALRPLGFADFAALYRPPGLEYVGDAVWADNVVAGYPPAFRALLADAPDAAAREQLVDHMRNSLFRRAVLVRAGQPIRWQPGADDLRGAYVALAGTWRGGDARGDRYASADEVELTVSDPTLRAGLARARERAPDAIPLASFLDGAPSPEACQLVLQAWAGGLVELLPRARPHSAPAGSRPAGYPLARWLAPRIDRVVNCCHQPVEIGPIERAILRICDGTRERAAIIDALLEAVRSGEIRLLDGEVPIVDPARQEQAIDERLDDRLARMRAAGIMAVQRPG